MVNKAKCEEPRAGRRESSQEKGKENLLADVFKLRGSESVEHPQGGVLVIISKRDFLLWCPLGRPQRRLMGSVFVGLGLPGLHKAPIVRFSALVFLASIK